jgi:hypothetical protein
VAEFSHRPQGRLQWQQAAATNTDHEAVSVVRSCTGTTDRRVRGKYCVYLGVLCGEGGKSLDLAPKVTNETVDRHHSVGL